MVVFPAVPTCGVDITGNLFRLFKIVESAMFDTAISVAVLGNYSTNVSIPLLLSSIFTVKAPYRFFHYSPGSTVLYIFPSFLSFERYIEAGKLPFY